MSAQYPTSMKWFHWMMGIAIIGLLAVGLYMEGLPKEDPNKWPLYDLHKAIGVCVLLLFLPRVLNRLRSAVPALPESIKPLEQKASHLGHLALYGLMLAMPVSGVVMSQSGGYPINVFGWVLPVMIDKNPALFELAKEAHELIGNALIVVVSIHVLAVIKHRVIEKTNLLERMGFRLRG